jgi:hypothetical protein
LHLAFAKQQPLHSLLDPLASLGRIQGLPLGILYRDVQQPQERGQPGFQQLVKGQKLADDLFADAPVVIPILNVEVPLQQGDDRQVWGRPAIGDRAGLDDRPAVGTPGVRDLPDEPRLPDAGLAHQRHHMAVTGRDPSERQPELLQFPIASDESRKPPRGSRT